MKTMRQTNSVPSPARALSLSIHKDSTSISSKPKIRIIHVFTPEIIKTDTANFRDLVQRLTGKPEADHESSKSRGKRTKVTVARQVREAQLVVPEKPKPRKAGHFDVFRGVGSRETKEEQGGSSSYLSDFTDLDHGFMHDLPVFQSPPQLIPYFDAATA